LATPRLLVHDRGRVLADVACAIAGGARAISDCRVLTDQQELFGPVASVPTVWRTLEEFGAGGQHIQARVTAAVNAARAWAWAAIEGRHDGMPPLRIADKTLPGVVGIRLDATVTPAHSDKEGAEPNFKGSVITRCCPTATTPVSRWPGCSATAARGRTPSATMSRC